MSAAPEALSMAIVAMGSQAGVDGVLWGVSQCVAGLIKSNYHNDESMRGRDETRESNVGHGRRK